jgi:phage tail sheath protein FI
MPITPTYPGVYIEEIPSGVHTITGVATSITAFIGRAAWGPVSDQADSPAPAVINSFGDYERLFGGLSLISPMSYAVRDFYLNGGSQAVIIRLAHGGLASTITLLPDTNLPASPIDSPLSSAFSNLVLSAASVGSWGSNLYALVDHKTKNTQDILLFNLTITLMDAARQRVLATEKFLNVSVDSNSARYVTNVLAQNSALVRVQQDSFGNDEVPGVRPAETYVTILSPPKVTPTPVWATAGDDGGDLDSNDFIGAGTEVAKTGLYALEKTDLFNLLCIPPYHNDDVDVDVVAATAAYCEQRRAFYLVDSPSDWNSKTTAVDKFTDAIQDWIGTRSKNAALFFPRLRQPNPLRDDQIESFVACGAVAGIFARTDAQRGVWKAPAGQEATLNGVPQLSVPLTDAENGELNPLGVNCLRAFPIIGRVIWGARTLNGADQMASEWKYVPVRRTALFIEESLYRGTKWVVFEPNDEPLWAQIRLNVGAFMHNLFRQGAFQGSNPRDAYFVKCDKETTTQNDIDLGIVNILVGFAPLKPAEFVVIQIQQMAGQIQV